MNNTPKKNSEEPSIPKLLMDDSGIFDQLLDAVDKIESEKG